jgi:hypothetical protein
MKAEDFMGVVRDPALVKELGLQGRNLEGYLYPEPTASPWGPTRGIWSD